MERDNWKKKLVWAAVILGGLLLAAALVVASVWPVLNVVETGRTPEYPDVLPQYYEADPQRVYQEVVATLGGARALAGGQGGRLGKARGGRGPNAIDGICGRRIDPGRAGDRVRRAGSGAKRFSSGQRGLWTKRPKHSYVSASTQRQDWIDALQAKD